MYLTKLKCRSALKPSKQTVSRSWVWARFIVALALSVVAFATRTPMALAWLTGADMLLVLFAQPGSSFLRKSAKTMVWQVGIISGLYWLRFGFSEGWLPGLIISWQLFLAFLPGAIFVETTPGHQIVRMLSDVLPYRMAFIMATCLNFIPLLLGEIKRIYEGQVLRGARILPRDLVNPRNWPDVLHCLVVPFVIQSMILAGEIALAAKARDFGRMRRRTFWPGDMDI